MKRIPMTSLFALALVVLVVPARDVAADTSSVTIENHSQWGIHHFHLSPTDQNDWGADQLGEGTVEAGESFTVQNIPCEIFDVKLVDEDGDECVIADVALCNESHVWIIEDEGLLACEGFGDEDGDDDEDDDDDK